RGYGPSSLEPITLCVLFSASPCLMTQYLFLGFFAISATDPTTFFSPHFEHVQIGRGVPQYLSREIAQSLTSRSHSPNLPSLMYSGSQFIFSFSLTSLSLK